MIRHAYAEESEIDIQLWQNSGIEPKLEGILADPLIQLVMQCDGVSRTEIEKVIDQTRTRLMAARGCSDVIAA